MFLATVFAGVSLVLADNSCPTSEVCKDQTPHSEEVVMLQLQGLNFRLQSKLKAEQRLRREEPQTNAPEFDIPDLPPYGSGTGLPGRVEDDHLTRVMLPQDIYGNIGGVAMNGDPTGYYYGASRTGESSMWVLHLQGGGACTTKQRCDKEVDKIPGKFRDVSREPPQTALSTSVDNPWRDAYHVYFPYVTEDLWAGQVVTPTNGTACGDDDPNTCCNQVGQPDYDENCVDQWGYHFSGHLAFKNIIHHIVSTEPASRHMTQVLLTGSSAGGIGVMNNCDFLQNFLTGLHEEGVLHNGVEVKCAPQAGFYLPGHTEDHEDVLLPPSHFDDYSVGQASEPDYDQLWHDILLHRKRLPEGCTGSSEFQSQTWACGGAMTMYPHIQTPVFVIQNKMDNNWALQFGMGPSPVTLHTCMRKSYLSYLGRSMENAVTNINIKAADGWFLASCMDHGKGIALGEGTIVKGKNSLEALHDWFVGNDELHILLDDCESEWGGPCNPTCHEDYLNVEVIEGPCCETELDSLCSAESNKCACAQNYIPRLQAAGCTREVVREFCRR